MITSTHAGSGKSTPGGLTCIVHENIRHDQWWLWWTFLAVITDSHQNPCQYTDERLSEAEFGAPTKRRNNHDYNRTEYSPLSKPYIDGFMGTEEKYERRKSQRIYFTRPHQPPSTNHGWNRCSFVAVFCHAWSVMLAVWKKSACSGPSVKNLET